ncbi:MAG: 30S ribosomal protein S21 [Flavobacteriaceae bacterium]|nr:30S ribosomal protein S21 [Flavobacteriaceae bacterium]
MLRVILKPGESIERALKRYKRKHRNVKLHEQLRDRKHFKKKSEKQRELIKKAQFKEKYLRDLENI